MQRRFFLWFVRHVVGPEGDDRQLELVGLALEVLLYYTAVSVSRSILLAAPACMGLRASQALRPLFLLLRET